MAAWDWINGNAAGIGVVLALIPGVWGVWTWVQIKRADQRQLRFVNYHQLVQWLVEKDPSAESMKVDRQTAVVFELRRYREYRTATIKILRSFKRQVGANLDPAAVEFLDEEIDETINKLKKTRVLDLFR